MKANFKSIILLILIVAGVLWAVSAFMGAGEEEEQFTYGDLVDALEVDAVKELTINGESTVLVKVYDYEYKDVAVPSDRPVLDEEGNPVFDGEGNPVYENDYVKTLFVYDTVKEHELVMVYSFQLERIDELAEGNERLSVYDVQPPKKLPGIRHIFLI